MYFVKYGTEYLHDPRVTGCELFDLSFDGAENNCGYCDFTIYSNHPLYNKLKERDAVNLIQVYEDEELMFSGFIYEIGTDFYLSKPIKCKGELEFLGDSIVRPYSTLQRGYGQQAPTSVNGYFEWLINQHNSQVDVSKQFAIGINQGHLLDSNNYIYRENDGYPTTLAELNEKLINILGGYIRIRHVNGVRYIDYLYEWTESNTQILDFGVNLTDYSQTDDSSNIATFVISIGASMSNTDYSYDHGYYITSDTTVDPNKDYYIVGEDGNLSKCSDLTVFEAGVTYYEYYEDWDESNCKLTISELPDGSTGEEGYIKSGDMIYSVDDVRRYGWIGILYSNDDITERENLVTKGVIALKEYISPKRTIEIKAVDMHLINPDLKSIKIGEYVRVRSKPHNLDSYFLCRNISLDLNNPANSIYTLGTTFDTLTGQQNKMITKLNKTINTQYEAATALSKEAKEVAKDAATTAEAALKKIESFDGAYIHIKYSDYSDGRNMYDKPSETTKYIGIKSNSSKDAPTDPSEYDWSLIKGTDGIKGDPGDDGKSSYLHIKYSPDGVIFSENFGETPAAWIGTYVDEDEADPMIFSLYNWKKIEGEPGEDGIDGIDGNGIDTITYYYKTSTTQTPPSADSITDETMPNVDSTNKYLWQKEVIKFTDTSIEDKVTVMLLAVYGDNGDKGDTGNGLSLIYVVYALSISKDTPPDDSKFSGTIPEWTDGQYIWEANEIHYTDGTVVIVGKNCIQSTAVDNLVIGGTNLARKTKEMATDGIYIGNNPVTASTFEIDDEGFVNATIAANGTFNHVAFYFPQYEISSLAGKQVIISFYARSSGLKSNPTGFQMAAGVYTDSSTRRRYKGLGYFNYSKYNYADLKDNEWVRVIWKGTLPTVEEMTVSSETEDYTKYGIAIYVNSNNTTDPLIFKKFKIEQGNTVTDYSQSPDDYELAIEKVETTYIKTADFEQSSTAFTMNFNTLQETVTTNNDTVTKEFKKWSDYIRFEDANIILGKADNSIKCKITNDRLSFLQNDLEVAYVSNNELIINKAQVNNCLRVGNFEFRGKADNGMVIVKAI